MAHIQKAKNSLTVEVRSEDGTLVAVFVCLDETELAKLNNAANLKAPVFVHVEHLRLFIGNAVVLSIRDE